MKPNPLTVSVRFFLVIVSCLIVSFSQPTFAPWLCPIGAAFGYALFWRAIGVYPLKKQRFWRAVLWYMVISLIQLSWMSSIEYQGPYILLAWLGFSIWVGVQFGMLTLLIPYNRPLKVPRILAIASAWTLLEWSRFYVLCGYSWNLSGLALSNPYALQFASIFGVLGLSFWVILANLFGLRALARKGVKQYAIWLGVACLPYVFGALHIAYHQKQMERTQTDLFSSFIVQTGLLPSQKTMLSGRDADFISPYIQWERILYLIKDKEIVSRNEKGPELIVLPESVVPYSSGNCVYQQSYVNQIFLNIFGPIANSFFPEAIFPYGDQETKKVSNAYWVQTLSNLFQTDVIIGLDHDDERAVAYSSAFYARPFKNSLDRYDKRILVPLVEYLPFSFLAPLVKGYGISEFFTRGEEAKIFDGKIPMSVSICYEETFPQNVREGRLKGAKMLINVTNDGWYPFTLLPSQHYEHAKFRAVENGAPLLRACNTGISAAVDSLGRLVGKLDERSQPPSERSLQSGVLIAKINPYEYSTPFTFWGNGGILSLSLIFLGVFVALKREFLW